MATIEDIIQRELDLLIVELRKNMVVKDRNATGHTSASIRANTKKIGSEVVEGTITANSNYKLLETGRNPSKGSPTGSSEWYDKLDDWLQARGIPLEAKFPIFKKIHEKGFKGTPNLISDPIDKALKRIEQRIADFYAEDFAGKIFKNF